MDTFSKIDLETAYNHLVSRSRCPGAGKEVKMAHFTTKWVSYRDEDSCRCCELEGLELAPASQAEAEAAAEAALASGGTSRFVAPGERLDLFRGVVWGPVLVVFGGEVSTEEYDLVAVLPVTEQEAAAAAREAAREAEEAEILGPWVDYY